MTRPSRVPLIGAALLALTLFGLASAEAEHALPAHDAPLVLGAHAIVLAKPMPPSERPGDGDMPQRAHEFAFEVDTLLTKVGPKAGTRIRVGRMAPTVSATVGDLPRVLLFLEPTTDDGESADGPPWLLFRQALYGHGENGRLVRPHQRTPSAFGEFPSVLAADARSFKNHVAAVRDTLALFAPLRASRRIEDRVERAGAVLTWVRAHRDALMARPKDPKPPVHPSSITPQLIQWIVQDGNAAQALEALQLSWAATPKYGMPGARSAARAFCSVEGRRLLYEIAIDADRFAHERLETLAILREHGALQPPHRDARGGKGLVPDEKSAMLPGLADLVKGGAPFARAAATVLAGLQTMYRGRIALQHYGVPQAVFRHYEAAQSKEEKRAWRRLVEALGGRYLLAQEPQQPK